MAALPVTSSESYTNPTQPFKIDEIDDHERRITILERSTLEQRVRAIEVFLFGP